MEKAGNTPQVNRPKKRIFLRFFILNCLIAFFTVTIFGVSIIPAQKKKIIADLKSYSNLIHSALYPEISSGIVLEDYGKAIGSTLKVIDENPIVRYVAFGRKTGDAILIKKKAWHQTSETRLTHLKSSNHQIIHSTLSNSEVFSSYYPLSFAGIDWGHIVVGLSTEAYHDDLRRLYLRTFWIALASVMVSLAMSFILARRMTKPIQELAETTHLIGNGDLAARSDIHTGDEIELLSRAINRMVEALEHSQDEIRKKHDALLDVAHRAGMAEVAIDVLHNIGNVLNSINVISSSVTNRVDQSRVYNIRLFAREFEKNRHRLHDYLATDGRVDKMIDFLTALVSHLENENKAISVDMAALSRHIAYIIDIIKCQQLYSKSAGIVERVSIDELINMAVQICGNTLSIYNIRLDLRNTDLPEMFLNRHKIIQILNNLINNAIDSVLEIKDRERVISISAEQTEDGDLLIRVEDNGIGVLEENMIKIFNHGFTTKKGGHGFGLHSCALFAQEMKGTLNVSSSGWNQGALFELRLPVGDKAGQV
jgi:signal transduction histidine kinase